MIVCRNKLFSLKEVVPFSQEIIDEFKGPGNMLRHCRWGKGMDGYALMDGGSKLAGYVVWSTQDKEIKGLEVIRDYRKQGLGEELLSLAEQMGITSLTVNKSNKPAIALYKKYGYIPTRMSGAMIWMKKL